jgi:hypothetical protein
VFAVPRSIARSEEKRLKSERKFMLAMVETSWKDQRKPLRSLFAW